MTEDAFYKSALALATELTNDQKQALRAELKKQLDAAGHKGRRKEGEDECCFHFVKLADIFMEAVGVTDRGTFMKDRARDISAARSLMLYALDKAGYTHTTIGRVAGLNHATVYQSVQRADFALTHPQLYPEYISIWKAYKSKIAKI